MELQPGPARPAADAVDSRAAPAPAPAPAAAFKKPLPSVNFGGSPGAGRPGRTATSDMDRPSTSLDRLPIQVHTENYFAFLAQTNLITKLSSRSQRCVLSCVDEKTSQQTVRGEKFSAVWASYRTISS